MRGGKDLARIHTYITRTLRAYIHTSQGPCAHTYIHHKDLARDGKEGSSDPRERRQYLRQRFVSLGEVRFSLGDIRFSLGDIRFSLGVCVCLLGDIRFSLGVVTALVWGVGPSVQCRLARFSLGFGAVGFSLGFRCSLI